MLSSPYLVMLDVEASSHTIAPIQALEIFEVHGEMWVCDSNFFADPFL